ncbi:MAG: DUF4181 domain-containing protein [Anaerobacillus sp.]|uniref:DUF4181 domain-containing protein n=1 Tax=Anaerobacillus sp. TaxID=1872506 RepID=UPI0039194070
MIIKKIFYLLIIVISGFLVFWINDQQLNLGIITPLPTTVFLIFALIFIIEDIFKEWFFGRERTRVSETTGRFFTLLGRTVLALVSMGIFIFFITKSTNSYTVELFWLSVLTVGLSFHAYTEWRYLKESKEYIVTLILLPICFLMIFLF